MKTKTPTKKISRSQDNSALAKTLPQQGVKNNPVVLEKFPGYFLIACLIVSFVGLFFLLKPFLVILVFAAILASVFHSLYVRILKLLGNHQSIAAFLTCLLIFVVIVIPLTFFVLLLAKQTFDIYNLILQKVQSGELDFYLRWQKGSVLYDFFQTLQTQFGGIIDFQSVDLKNDLVNFVKNVSSFLVQESAVFLKGVGSLIFGFFLLFFLLFFSLYYFLKDADFIAKKISLLSPLPEQYNYELFRKFKEISKATLYGIFLTSIAQGLLGGIGFTIVGIPNGLFWGTAMAFFSLIPIVGTALIWFPAAVMLIVSGNLFGGIFLFLWGLVLISSVDNFLRIFFIGNQINMNPLLAFLSVFGGIALFNFVGVIFGPLILMFFLTFLHIYQLEYKNLLRK